MVLEVERNEEKISSFIEDRPGRKEEGRIVKRLVIGPPCPK